MRITILINTANEAFYPNPADEVARILRDLADKFTDVGMIDAKEPIRIRDVNGNTVGAISTSDD